MENHTLATASITPPHNIEAEQALLGAILANNRAYEKVAEYLQPEHFMDPVHGRIYGAIVKLLERGQLANAVTLKQYFEADEGLSAVGGAEYLASLEASVISYVSVADYGQAIFDCFLRRELIDLGTDVISGATTPDIDAPAVAQIEQAEQRLFNLASKGVAEGGFISFNDSLKQAIATAEAAARNGGGIVGVASGFRDLDKMLGGLHPSDLIILAARPSMGKTAFATNIAFNAAKAFLASQGKSGGRVAFFSLEMSAEQLALRILSEQTEISSEKIRRGEIRDQDFTKFVTLSQELQRLHLYIDETPGLSVMGVRTRARRLKRTVGLDMIVIDYLQLMSGSGGKKSEANRVQEVSEISRGLKALAKELHVPVIALSQLSRKVEERDDKKPQLADLRESGSIEQDADMVMFIYREEYYLKRAEPGRHAGESDDKYNERYALWQQRLEKVYNVAEVIIAKQRHGPVGTVRLFFDGQFTRFTDLEENRKFDDE
jgi:replicative DNA helicase